MEPLALLSVLAVLNLALEGIASQSSTHGHYAAARAIDGNTNGDMFKQSCTHTKQTDDPWWMITFKYMILAHEVLIVNRDECCGKYLTNFVSSFSLSNCEHHYNNYIYII